MASRRYLTFSVRLELVSLTIVAVLIGVNLLAAMYVWRWDVTSERIYQLSPLTREALGKLDAPLRVLLFAQPSEFPMYRDRLKEYDLASRRVEVEHVDVKQQQGLVRQYEVQQARTIALEYKDRVELVGADSEQDFTNALTRLLEGRVRKAYFTTGHAERDTDSTERVGYSTVASVLRHENFAVEKINLAQRGEIPADATVIVVAGPRVDFFRAEADAFQGYLQKGGKALLLVDPFEDLKRYITDSGMALFMMDPSSATGAGELRNLTGFIADWGVELGKDVIVDTSEMGKFLGTDASVPVAVRYPPHPITRGFTSLTAFPMARSVTLRSKDSGKPAQSIVETADQTWAEADIQQLGAGHLSLDVDKGDRPGPISVAAAVSSPVSGSPPGHREARMVVVGDSDFVANYSTNVPGNTELFLDIINWLTQESLIEIPHRAAGERKLDMEASQQRVAFWMAVVLLPALFVGAGLYLRGRS